jgi:membrane protease YdiL (CAAX protease family)
MGQHLLRLHFSPGPVVLQIFYAVVAAPLCEETLFRGFTLTTLRAHGLSSRTAAATSLAAFALIHVSGFGVGGAIFIALWGTIPTALFLARGSLAPGWMMHTANNTWAYLLYPALR